MNSVFNPLMKWFLTRFYDLLYHSMAWIYDIVSASVSLGHWNDWVRVVLPEIKGLRVLELGFGPGHLLLAIGNTGVRVVGLDESMQMCRIANRRLHKKRNSPYQNIIVRGRAESLPFLEEGLDCIVATFPSDYILDLRTVTECFRVLKPGGQVVILVGVKIGGSRWYRRFLRQIYQITHQSVEEIEAHTNWITPIKRVGFQVDSIKRQYLEDELSIVLLVKDETPFSS